MWVNDTQNNLLDNLITNGTIIANCNGVSMIAHTGYFSIISMCVGPLNIINTITAATIFTLLTAPT